MEKITLPEIANNYRNLNIRITNNEFGPEHLFAKIQRVVLGMARMLEMINLVHRISKTKSRSDINEDNPSELTMDEILRVLRMGFIEIMSRIEFYSKKQIRVTTQQYLKELQNKQRQQKYVYLYNIIETAEGAKKISVEDKKFWEYIIHIRNCLVHNSGISNKDFETMIGELEVKKDKGINGVIMDFYKLTEKTVELYSRLAKIF